MRVAIGDKAEFSRAPSLSFRKFRRRAQFEQSLSRTHLYLHSFIYANWLLAKSLVTQYVKNFSERFRVNFAHIVHTLAAFGLLCFLLTPTNVVCSFTYLLLLLLLLLFSISIFPFFLSCFSFFLNSSTQFCTCILLFGFLVFRFISICRKFSLDKT